MKSTLLVLGAGASHPYGLPLGTDLLKEIRHIADSVLQALRHAHPSQITTCIISAMGDARISSQQLEELIRVIDHSQTLSIDAILAHRTDLADLGKLLIAACLLPEEYTATIGGRNRPPSSEHWYGYLFSKMNSSRDGFSDDLRVLTLNYENTFEYHASQHLRFLHDLTIESAISHVENMRIVHMHGSIGTLSELYDRKANEAVTTRHIQNAAKSIRLVHEVKADDRLSDTISDLFSEVEQIIFLGFAFHPLTCNLLNEIGCWQSCLDSLKDDSIMSSCFNFGEGQRKEARHYLSRNIQWGQPSMMAHDFLREHVSFV